MCGYSWRTIAYPKTQHQEKGGISQLHYITCECILESSTDRQYVTQLIDEFFPRSPESREVFAVVRVASIGEAHRIVRDKSFGFMSVGEVSSEYRHVEAFLGP